MSTGRLRIVGLNDIYSLTPLPQLASLVLAQDRSEFDCLLITVAGDFLAPSVLSSLDGGRGMVDCLNALEATHVTLGNHEDDLPLEELLGRLEEIQAKVLLTNSPNFQGRHQRIDTVEVGAHRVGLVGLLEGDVSLFRRPPFGGTVLSSTSEVARAVSAELREAGCAAVVALTHQRMGTDHDLADLGLFDLILGGHQHEGYLEPDRRTPLAKAPMNATSVVIADLVLRAGEKAEVRVRFQSLADYPEQAEMRARVDHHLEPVLALEARVLHSLAPGEVLSSDGSRHRQTSMGTLVCSRLRDSMGAEAAVFNGGGLRGTVEHREAFSYADLQDEIPFNNEVVVIDLPGAVLAEAIQYARGRLKTSGGFLQVDDHTEVDERHLLTRVAGADFDPARRYQVTMVRDFLLGMDGIEPLIQYAQAHPEAVPVADSGQPTRAALLSAFLHPKPAY